MRRLSKNKTNLLLFLTGLVFLVIIFSSLVFQKKQVPPAPVSFVTFQQMVSDKEVTTASIDLNAAEFTFTDTEHVMYKTDNPKENNFKRFLLDNNIQVKEIQKETISPGMIMSIVIELILIVFLFKTFSGNAKGLTNSHMNNVKIPSTRFVNIAGNEEIQEEVETLVDFLKNPRKYKKMGAKLPKGIILYGPPGTGKTLTAKAVAGEAGVPFFSISGSDFVELYVGMGARKVRDLFSKAKKKAPCIIFIDEIDAVGTERGSSLSSEHKQTLDELLKQLDGFSENDGIIVMAATNRIEDLDPALVRPGRFDKHLKIDLPDQKDRLKIIENYAKTKPIAPEVSLDELSKITIWFSGAAIESLLNESAILAARRNKELITKEEVDDAYMQILTQGNKKKNGHELETTKKLVAWHEGGHALCYKLLTHKEVPKVSIEPSTSGFGGITLIPPSKMGLFSKNELLNDVKVSYAGRIGEYLLLKDDNEITTGASNDIEQATEKIKAMITKYGMSRFGMLNLSKLDIDSKLILEEASKLAHQLYSETLELLESHKETLQHIAEALIDKEKLTDAELNELIS